MRSPVQSSRGTLGFNMTPMIDISFLLIIFFIVSSHLAQQEVHFELPLPQATSGATPPADAARRLVLNVLADGSMVVSGKPLPAEELDALIRQEQARAEEEFEVRIRTDRAVAYRHIEPILLACTRAGVWKVSFAVTRP